MASLTSNLDQWGSTGTAPPDGYNYLEGEQPVDEWDNNVVYHTIEEIHELQSLANGRIESDKGTQANRPGSPEASHLYFNTDDDRLEAWDAGDSSWRPALYRDGDSLTGDLNVNNRNLNDVQSIDGGGDAVELGDPLDLASNNLVDGGTTIWDGTKIPQGRLENSGLTVTAGDGLKGGGQVSLGGTISLNLEPADVAGSGLQDDGSDNLELANDTVTIAGKTVSLGGSTSIALDDLSNVSATAEGSGGGLNADTVDGVHAADLVSASGDTVGGTINLSSGEYQVGGNTVAKAVPATGQVSLSGGTAVVDTGISATDATFQLALGVDDPDADTKIGGRMFWDDSVGTYHIEIFEQGTAQNPTVNYDVVRVR